MKEFFNMTRHERMGTIAILVVVATLLLGTLVLKHCSPQDVDPQLEEEILKFGAEVDSAKATDNDTTVTGTSRPSAREGHQSRRKKAGKARKKPSRQPARRPIDPVPQF